MGKRGPKRLPIETLRQRGSWLAGQRRDVDFPVGAPKPPAWLSGEALQAWDCLVPMLQQRGVLTRADGMALACLCKAWARFIEAENLIAGEGLTVQTVTGGLKAHPAVAISAMAWGQVVKGCALFGIDPADRSSVSPAAPGKDYDDMLADQGALLMEQIKAKGVKNNGRK